MTTATPVPPAPLKQCIVCGDRKAFEHFDLHTRGEFGRGSRCKSCLRKDRDRVRQGLSPAAAPFRRQREPLNMVRSVDPPPPAPDEPEDEAPPDYSLQPEHRARANMWKAYCLAGGRDTGRGTPHDHQLDEDAIARWANVAVAALRSGKPLRAAIAAANADEDRGAPLTPEDPPVDLFGKHPMRHEANGRTNRPLDGARPERTAVSDSDSNDPRRAFRQRQGDATNKPTIEPGRRVDIGQIQPRAEAGPMDLALAGARVNGLTVQVVDFLRARPCASVYDVALHLDVEMPEARVALGQAERHGLVRHFGDGRRMMWALIRRLDA